MIPLLDKFELFFGRTYGMRISSKEGRRRKENGDIKFKLLSSINLFLLFSF
jgi:hypothetical protein